MSQTVLGKTKRSLASFAIILALFLVVADAFLITQQSRFLRTEMDIHTKHEFNLFSKLVDAMLERLANPLASSPGGPPAQSRTGDLQRG